MDLNALRYFAVTAQFGSITKAAAHLNVAQPAVSRQIRKLERDLGVPLLTRTAQGVTLTGEGDHLLARTSPILQILNQTRDEVRNWDKDPAGPVSVALMPAVAPVVAPLLAARVRDAYPMVRLSLSEGLSAVIRDGVLAGQFDLGLYHADREVPSLSVEHLLDEPMFLIGPGGPSKARVGGPVAVRLEDLPDYPLLLPEPPNPLRRMIDALTEDQGLNLDIRETVNSTSMIKTMVAAGLGYTVQSYSFFHEDMQRSPAVFHVARITGMTRNWSLARLADRPPVGAVSAVARTIGEIAADLARTHQWRPPPAA